LNHLSGYRNSGGSRRYNLGRGLEWGNGFEAPRFEVQQEPRGDAEGGERVEIGKRILPSPTD